MTIASCLSIASCTAFLSWVSRIGIPQLRNSQNIDAFIDAFGSIAYDTLPENRALNRITQSAASDRPIPPIFAAWSRELPSSTAAIAENWRACAAFFTAAQPAEHRRSYSPSAQQWLGKRPSICHLETFYRPIWESRSEVRLPEDWYYHFNWLTPGAAKTFEQAKINTLWL